MGDMEGARWRSRGGALLGSLGEMGSLGGPYLGRGRLGRAESWVGAWQDKQGVAGGRMEEAGVLGRLGVPVFPPPSLSLVGPQCWGWGGGWQGRTRRSLLSSSGMPASRRVARW